MNHQEVDQLLTQLVRLDPGAPDRQFEAAVALPKAATPANRAKIVRALIAALTVPQSLVRAHAAEALGLLGDPGAVVALIPALKDRYQLVRSYAARALGKLGDQSAIEPLIEVLANDTFFGARAEAAEALRHLCPNDRTPPCRKARDALKQHREQELKRNEERSRRVLAEMDLSLKELGAIINRAQEALQQNKTDYAATLLQALRDKLNSLQDTRDRIGGLTASLART